ncbi:MAG: hypothetical protein NT023_03940, partial [Armatimonadetes bacterium]|nr:hypothetical protein [Armatimonadota bacterium]
ITEEEIAEVKPLIDKAFQDEKCFSYALHFSRDIGDDIFLEWDATPLFHDGKMVALFWVGHDVTSARKAELEYKHLYQIAQAINASTKLDDILLMVRNALKEVSGFDRVGVWLAQGGQLIGAWGTNLDGSIADERGRRMRLPEFIPEVYAKIQSGEWFGTLALTEWVMQDSSVVTTEKPLDFAFMTLRVQGELVGIMFADNYPTQRGLVLEEVARLLPLGGE